MEQIAAVALGYVIGSIPFAYLLSRRHGIDLRRVGSGNVGATNVLRTSGAGAAVVAMLLDALKGSAAVVAAERLAPGAAIAVAGGLASVIGHIYPVWLGFRGGKGVATAAGALGLLAPAALAIASAAFVVAVWVTRYISVGSVVAAMALAGATVAGGAPGVVCAGAAIAAAVIVFGHRGNLARLRAGTERRIGQRLF